MDKEAPPPPLEKAHACPLLFHRAPRPAQKESEEGGISQQSQTVLATGKFSRNLFGHTPRVLIGRCIAPPFCES